MAHFLVYAPDALIGHLKIDAYNCPFWGFGPFWYTRLLRNPGPNMVAGTYIGAPFCYIIITVNGRGYLAPWCSKSVSFCLFGFFWGVGGGVESLLGNPAPLESGSACATHFLVWMPSTLIGPEHFLFFIDLRYLGVNLAHR